MDDETLRSAVGRLLDLEEIRKLKARYFRTLDGKQWDEFRQVFTPDMTADLGPLGTFVGREAFMALVQERLSDGRSVHHGHTSEIDFLDSDHATGVWAMFDYVDPPTRETIMGYGHYEEVYRREPEGWRISAVRLVRIRVDILNPPE